MSNEAKSVRFSDLYGIIQSTLEKDGSITFTARGSSMLPLIRSGKDRVTLEKIERKPKKNDVIFYRRENGDFVLHRVVKIRNDAALFCGDHQFQLEKGVSSDHMIGIMTGLERNGCAYDLNGSPYRLYCTLLPCRRAFFKVRHFLGNMVRFIRRKR